MTGQRFRKSGKVWLRKLLAVTLEVEQVRDIADIAVGIREILLFLILEYTINL